MCATFSMFHLPDTLKMIPSVTLLVYSTFVSLGYAFPGDFDGGMRYLDGNNYAGFYSQQYRNTFPNNEYVNGCGAREVEFGRDVWHFLHTMAANYPEDPSPKQQANMMEMMRLFSDFYPHPNYYYRRSIMGNQPDTRNRESFSQWMCMIHNMQNEQKSKPQFDCSTVLDVWTNDCYQNSGDSCDPGKRDFGRASWNYLHTYAFTYPDNPSPRQQEDMRRLMYLTTEFYPAPSYYYTSSVLNDDPDTSNRESFMNWVCRTHNYVNAWRGKPEFDCNEVWDHWRYNGCED